MNRFKIALTASALLVIFTGISRADQMTLGAAAGYNVFVFGNFTEYNTDAQGKMAIGGNFAPANGGSFTIAGTSGDPAGVFDLVVGGNFTQTGNSMGGGDVYVGGSMTWNDPSLPHNAYVVGNFMNGTSGGSTGGTIYYGGAYSSGDMLSHTHVTAGSIAPPINFASAVTELDNLSISLGADAANGTVSHSYSTYTLSGADPTLNIFDMTDSNYSGATINISAPAGSTVVINVPGASASFTYGSINLSGGVSINDVIFNFDAATTLALNGIGFNGSILAPFADFTGTWGDIDGELIAKSAAGTTQINDMVFSGNLGSTSSQGTSGLSPTPEPSTWMALASGLAALAMLGWHRTRLPQRLS